MATGVAGAVKQHERQQPLFQTFASASGCDLICWFRQFAKRCRSPRANGGFLMPRFRHLVWIALAAAGLLFVNAQARAQQPDVGDQPGLLPDESVELDPE